MGQGAQGSEVAAGKPKLMAQPGSLSGRPGQPVQRARLQ